PASFQINYNIAIEQSQMSLFDKESIYFEYLNNFITYCIYDLSQDAPKLASYDLLGEVPGFRRLHKQYLELCGPGAVEDSNFRVEAMHHIKTDLLHAFDVLQSISSAVGPFYSEIVFANLSQGGTKELGIIDESLNASIEKAAIAVKSSLEVVVEEDDEEPYD